MQSGDECPADLQLISPVGLRVRTVRNQGAQAISCYLRCWSHSGRNITRSSLARAAELKAGLANSYDYLREKQTLAIVAHTFNPNTHEADVSDAVTLRPPRATKCVPGWPGLQWRDYSLRQGLAITPAELGLNL